jgi:hypothetical protein
VRIYDADSKRVLDEVTLYLTPSEAKELADPAASLAEDPQKHHHHVADSDHKREIIVAVYTPENRAQFDAESKRVIDAP